MELVSRFSFSFVSSRFFDCLWIEFEEKRGKKESRVGKRAKEKYTDGEENEEVIHCWCPNMSEKSRARCGFFAKFHNEGGCHGDAWLVEARTTRIERKTLSINQPAEASSTLWSSEHSSNTNPVQFVSYSVNLNALLFLVLRFFSFFSYWNWSNKEKTSSFLLRLIAVQEPEIGTKELKRISEMKGRRN